MPDLPATAATPDTGFAFQAPDGVQYITNYSYTPPLRDLMLAQNPYSGTGESSTGDVTEQSYLTLT